MNKEQYFTYMRIVKHAVSDIEYCMHKNEIDKNIRMGVMSKLNEMIEALCNEQRIDKIKQELSKCQDNIQTIRLSYGMLSTAERIELFNAVAQLRAQEEMLKNELNCKSVPITELVPRMQQGDAEAYYQEWCFEEFFDLSPEDQSTFTEASWTVQWHRARATLKNLASMPADELTAIEAEKAQLVIREFVSKGYAIPTITGRVTPEGWKEV